MIHIHRYCYGVVLVQTSRSTSHRIMSNHLETYVNRFLMEPYSPRFAQEALAAAPQDINTRRIYLTALAEECHMSYSATSAPLHLEKAISLFRILVDANSQNGYDPAYPANLRKLGYCLVQRYFDSENLDHVNEAAMHFQRSLSLSTTAVDRAKTLSALLEAVKIHVSRGSTADNIIPLIQGPSFAIAQEGVGLSNVRQTLIVLVRAVVRFIMAKLAGIQDPNPCRAPISTVERELYLPTNNSEQLEPVNLLLFILAKCYDQKYEQTHEMAYLQEAIRVGHERLAVSMRLLRASTRLLSGEKYLANSHSDLRSRFWYKYMRSFCLQDLAKAITHGEKALCTTPDNDLNRSGSLTDLGVLWSWKYERSGDPRHLEKSLELLNSAGEVTPPEHDNRAQYLISHSNRLQTRYEDFGTESDLQRAVLMATEALPLSQAPYQDFGTENDGTENNRQRMMDTEALLFTSMPLGCDRALALNSLANKLGLRYQLKGDPVDLQQAISKAQEAVAITLESNRERATYMNTLTRWLCIRAVDTSATEDLDRAIAIARTTVNSTIDVFNLQYLHQSSLANLLKMKFGRTGDPRFLKEAFTIAKDIVKEAGKDHPYRTLFWSLLSDLIQTVTENANDHNDLYEEADLRESLSLARAALRATSPRNINRPLLKAQLADLLEFEYKVGNRGFENIWEAVELGQAAVDEMQRVDPNHPSLAYLRLELALRQRSYRITHIWTAGNLIWHKEQPALYVDAFESESGPPTTRIRAGWLAGQSYASAGRWSDASDILDKAVGLLPLISPRWLSRDDQQHVLNNMSGLSALAATAALRANKGAAHALKVLEAGRGIIAGLMMDFRSDLADLRKKHPQKAEEHSQIRDRISSGILEFSTGVGMSATFDEVARVRQGKAAGISAIRYSIDDRRKDVERLQKLEEDIRKLEGFQNFQSALSSAETISLAGDGHFVCFNVTEHGSDAIFVNKNGINYLPLEHLEYSKIQEKAKLVAGEQKLSLRDWRTQQEDNAKLRNLLAWLWNNAVSQVLDYLHLREPRESPSRPRIWWVTSGQMGLMPVHAAGDYADDGSFSESTSIYALSSYTPTIKAHSFSQNSILRHLETQGQKVLVVAMSKTPGEVDLDANEESDLISQSIEPIKPIILPEPTRSEAVQELRTSTVAHFTCHGTSDSQDPSRSALLLRNPDDSTKCDRLTVRELATITHDRAQIAYLSACSTAENSSDALIDEAIHLASAFQLIGFPHVIGTLWEAYNKTATELARLFYTLLMEKMNSTGWGGDVSVIAESLGEAVEIIREDDAENFLAWAPFIHLGP